jgi:hypothetical protein
VRADRAADRARTEDRVPHRATLPWQPCLEA